MGTAEHGKRLTALWQLPSSGRRTSAWSWRSASPCRWGFQVALSSLSRASQLMRGVRRAPGMRKRAWDGSKNSPSRGWSHRRNRTSSSRAICGTHGSPALHLRGRRWNAGYVSVGTAPGGGVGVGFWRRANQRALNARRHSASRLGSSSGRGT